MSLCLALDTSLNGIRAALLCESEPCVLWHYTNIDHKSTASSLLTELKSKFSLPGFRLDDIESIMVGIGPGSFTGIKISLAFAYGLCETTITRRPLYGFSMLKLLAEHFLSNYTLIVLPSTQRAAFIAYKVDGSVTLKNYYFLEDDKSLPSSVLVSPLVISDIKLEVCSLVQTADYLGFEKINSLSIDLMSKEFKRSWPQRFNADLPQPLYLRKSTPEERMV